jgi:hypothetical protein
LPASDGHVRVVAGRLPQRFVARLCAVVSAHSRHFFLDSRFGIVLAGGLFVARATRHFARKAASVAFIIRFYHFISPGIDCPP